jgi:hypothetical protein
VGTNLSESQEVAHPDQSRQRGEHPQESGIRTASGASQLVGSAEKGKRVTWGSLSVPVLAPKVARRALCLKHPLVAADGKTEHPPGASNLPAGVPFLLLGAPRDLDCRQAASAGGLAGPIGPKSNVINRSRRVA